MHYKIENVEALWPRINRTYKFDSNERKSVPCDPKDPLAAYDMSFRMTKEQAQALWKEMCKAYKDKSIHGKLPVFHFCCDNNCK